MVAARELIPLLYRFLNDVATAACSTVVLLQIQLATVCFRVKKG